LTGPGGDVVETQTIHTRRLALLPLSVGHADEMATVLADPALYAFIGGTPVTARALRTRYEKLVAGSPDPSTVWCNWVINSTHESCLVGTVQATITSEESGRVAEIAWLVGTPWQGQGIAIEAARALVDWLRQQHVRTVVAHIHPGHRASSAVATAAGFTPTSHRSDGELRWERPTGR
jgi:RimJ/RimL family protein N-acetyltransferase